MPALPRPSRASPARNSPPPPAPPAPLRALWLPPPAAEFWFVIPGAAPAQIRLIFVIPSAARDLLLVGLKETPIQTGRAPSLLETSKRETRNANLETRNRETSKPLCVLCVELLLLPFNSPTSPYSVLPCHTPLPGCGHLHSTSIVEVTFTVMSYASAPLSLSGSDTQPFASWNEIENRRWHRHLSCLQ